MKIAVGPVDYRIRKITNLRNDEGECLMGVHRQSKLEICLAADMPTQLSFVILWHELLHAVNANRGLELEEGRIEQLAWGIAEVLKDSGNDIATPWNWQATFQNMEPETE